MKVTVTDHNALVTSSGGKQFYRTTCLDFAAFPEPIVTYNCRRVEWPRVAADEEQHAEIYQLFVRFMLEFEGTSVDPDLMLSTQTIFFDKVKAVFYRDWQGRPSLVGKAPEWFTQDCKRAKLLLKKAVRECEWEDIKCARHKRALKAARKK
ncbi:hypothetical protein NDU88_002163 [Pleurodeles waltl]|uniref:Uncharacterized protein n=1 Tax=Pleurodeles waltl TaxID=8319 RepID=A0AAV7UZ19_PLEWA|nr:hypothetical protein NDU88_002163 [Pleurodeles waltl]